MTKQELTKFRKRRVRILAMIADGMSQADIARELGMSRQRVCQIIRGK